MNDRHTSLKCRVRPRILVNTLQAKLTCGVSDQDVFHASLNGLISRGVKSAEIDENGHLIFTMSDNSRVDLGEVVGEPGPPGPPGRDGASTWNELQDKPFERIGDTLKVEDGTLDVNIYEAENPSGGNTLYIGG